MGKKNIDATSTGKPNSRPFNQRAFTASMSALTGIGLPFTGLATHLYQSNPFGLARHAWMAAHTVLGILFVIFVVWHVVINWRPLVRHFKSPDSTFPPIRREASIAAVSVILALFVAVGHAFLD